MKYLLWFLLFVSVRSMALLEEGSSLYNKSLSIFQSIIDESPENYEMETEGLTEQDFKKIVFGAETEIDNHRGGGILHIMAQVRSYQNYFAEQILSIVERLNVAEAKEVVFKRNRNNRSAYDIAKKAGNETIQQVLSIIQNAIVEHYRNKDKRNWIKTEIRTFSGLTLIFSIHGIAVLLGELPLGIAEGLASFVVSGVSCSQSFQKIRELQNFKPVTDKLNLRIQIKK